MRWWGVWVRYMYCAGSVRRSVCRTVSIQTKHRTRRTVRPPLIVVTSLLAEAPSPKRLAYRCGRAPPAQAQMQRRETGELNKAALFAVLLLLLLGLLRFLFLELFVQNPSCPVIVRPETPRPFEVPIRALLRVLSSGFPRVLHGGLADVLSVPASNFGLLRRDLREAQGEWCS